MKTAGMGDAFSTLCGNVVRLGWEVLEFVKRIVSPSHKLLCFQLCHCISLMRISKTKTVGIDRNQHVLSVCACMGWGGGVSEHRSMPICVVAERKSLFQQQGQKSPKTSKFRKGQRLKDSKHENDKGGTVLRRLENHQPVDMNTRHRVVANFPVLTGITVYLSMSQDIFRETVKMMLWQVGLSGVWYFLRIGWVIPQRRGWTKCIGTFMNVP